MTTFTETFRGRQGRYPTICVVQGEAQLLLRYSTHYFLYVTHVMYTHHTASHYHIHLQDMHSQIRSLVISSIHLAGISSKQKSLFMALNSAPQVRGTQEPRSSHLRKAVVSWNLSSPLENCILRPRVKQKALAYGLDACVKRRTIK